MKKLSLICLIVCCVLTSCKDENDTAFVIEGNAPNVYNGIRAYLKEFDPSGTEIVKDTAIVMNEKFQFKGDIGYPTVRILTIDGLMGNLAFMLEPGEIEIDVNTITFPESKVTGSETHIDYKNFQSGILDLQEIGRKKIVAYRTAMLNKDSIAVDSLLPIIEEHKSSFKNYAINFAEEHPESFLSLHLLEMEVNKPDVDADRLNDVFQKLDSDIKESSKGVTVLKQIDIAQIQFQKTKRLRSGEMAPRFSAPSPTGEDINLEDVKGKLTVIDFWAAWCGPCRRENPNLVKLYEEYHDKGLEILGVSLDGAPNQQDPKQAWLDAIEKDKLTWPQVSNLQYFNGPVASLYNITAIPATYVLDEEGRILAKNLRGPALRAKVDQLLGEQNK
ncbi:TlpA disulfide reductase family protein [Winogradskyella ursingii]|uniref:TlpA disulfide reductase family protein n=1 Tax=Winogradskyella ursingii TaxID=2686079 RepID=UPI0015C858C9|nr:TlpA disulfide reductase family protein [Winogradskyella ursingii]